MKVWVKQRHNRLIDSYRFGIASFSADRATVLCPESGNLLISCSRQFFDKEVINGRIVTSDPKESDS